jgi:hypothetical protein
MPVRGVVFAVSPLLVVAGLATGAGPAQAQTTTITVEVPVRSEAGVSTGVTLASGDRVTVTASGAAQTNPAFPVTGPDGLYPDGGSGPCPWGDIPCLAPTRASALIGKVGAAAWTYVGTGPTAMTGVGAVWLAYNDAPGYFGDNSGGYTAVLTVRRATAGGDVPADPTAGPGAPTCTDSALRKPIKRRGVTKVRQGRVVKLRFGCDDRSLRPKLRVERASSMLAARGTFRDRRGVYRYRLRTQKLKLGRYRLNIDLGNGVTITARIKVRPAPPLTHLDRPSG